MSFCFEGYGWIKTLLVRSVFSFTISAFGFIFRESFYILENIKIFILS